MGFAMWSERVEGRTMVFSCAPLLPECILVPFPVHPGGHSSMDTKLHVPILTVTNTLNRMAKRAGSNTEKAYLFEIVDGLAEAVAIQHPDLKRDEFIQACGVSPTWATQAA
jgi:hypothetical protein